jgi:hypothetical protein
MEKKSPSCLQLAFDTIEKIRFSTEIKKALSTVTTSYED